MENQYDVVIIGGGVSGTALLYTLSHYTDIKNIALVEKYHDFAQVNSKKTHNSQTLHFGDIETNYTVEKATQVKRNTDMVRRYVEKREELHDPRKIYSKYNKMVLAVGHDQVNFLEKRYESFKNLFPNLKKIGKDEIGRLEPKVLEGRDPSQELLALSTPDGYTVDFGALAKSFGEESKKKHQGVEFFFNSYVEKIAKSNSGYLIHLKDKTISAKFVVVAAGGHSLYLAQKMGFGKDFSILSVAGSFFWAPNTLNGKVYTIQADKLPFAAVHGDPDVSGKEETRFGPTAKAIPMLERYNWSSMPEYFSTFGFRWSAISSLIKIISDVVIFKYIFKNFLYDIPLLGRYLFLKEVRKIVPNLKFSELRYAKGMGGTRPQIINTIKKSLDMGEAKITQENIIFNITPSPGASTCLGNAYNDVQTISKAINLKFEKERFEKDFIA